MLILLPLGVSAQVGFLEIQGVSNGPAALSVFMESWTEPLRRELSEHPVLLELVPGTYSVEVQREGFEGFSETVTIVRDEVRIVRPRLVPILTQVRLIHLLPAEVPFRVGDERGTTPTTVQVPVGEQVMLVDAVPFCLRFAADSTAYVRIRSGVLEEIRGATECAVPPTHELFPLERASPLGMIIPPASPDLAGIEVTVWIFVDDTGRVVPDSTRLEPPTRDSGFNRRLIREAAEWAFRPAQRNGRAVPSWFPFRISM
jgi:hypothetical protein